MTTTFDDNLWPRVSNHLWKWRKRTRRIRLVLIHTTRSGQPNFTSLKEYEATRNWFESPNNKQQGRTEQYGGMASYIVGGGKIAQVMPEDVHPVYSLGHGDREGVSIEIAQATGETPIAAEDFDLAAQLTADICKRHNIPPVMLPWLSEDNHEGPGIARHDRSDNGRDLGKSDPGVMFHDQDFEALVRRYMGQSEEDEPPQEDDMPLKIVKGTTAWTYATNGMQKWLIPNQTVLHQLQDAGILERTLIEMPDEALNAIPTIQ